MSLAFDDLLYKTLSGPRLDLLHRVAKEAVVLKTPLYIVGGFVRDLLLGRPSLDFDLVVEGDAIKLGQVLVHKYGGNITVHEKFRTAKIDVREWEIESRKADDGDSLHSIDLISSRSEIYKYPAALPTVKMGDMTDDLRRRDFTINTLAIRLDGSHFGELRDDLGGLDDLKNGWVRVLHPLSFHDDPTRMLRAVRYEQRYGFQIAQDTLRLIPDACNLIEKLSAQRIRHELDLILDEANHVSMTSRLSDLDLLRSIHPYLGWDNSVRKRLGSSLVSKTTDFGVNLVDVNNRDVRWLLWLMNLSARQIESVDHRLHFTAKLLKSLIDSSQLWRDLDSFARLKPSQCVERLSRLQLDAVYAVLLAAPDGKSKRALEKYLSEWRFVKPKTTGHDLKKLGVEPGPKYQSILRMLRNARLDGAVKDAAEERKYLEELLA